MPGWGRWDRWARSGQWGDGGGVELVWLLRDLFTTDDAAPITSPRTCEPGPGTLLATEVDGSFAVTGEELVFTAQTTPATGDQKLNADDGITRDAGIGLFQSLSLTTGSTGVVGLVFGWSGVKTTSWWNNDSFDGFYLAFGETNVYGSSSSEVAGVETGIGTFDNAIYGLIARSVGAHYIKDGVLLWVGTLSDAVTLYYLFSNYATAGNLPETSILDLPANGYTEWDEDFSTVTDSESSPASLSYYDINPGGTHTRFTFTYEAGKYVNCYFRHDGTSAYAVVSCTSTGSISLTDQATSKFIVAGVFSDGIEYQIDIIDDTENVSVFVDNVQQSTTQTCSAASGEDQGRWLFNLAINDIVLSTHPYPALGIATDRVIAPQTTDTFTHTDDFLAYIRNVTLPTAGSTEYFFRIAGADEITLQLASDGSLALLDNATSRITAGAATISNGDDVALICDGASGEVFVAGTSAGSTAAIAVTTGAAGKRLDAQDGVADSIELFPRDVSSLLPGNLV